MSLPIFSFVVVVDVIVLWVVFGGGRRDRFVGVGWWRFMSLLVSSVVVLGAFGVIVVVVIIGVIAVDSPICQMNTAGKARHSALLCSVAL